MPVGMGWVRPLLLLRIWCMALASQGMTMYVLLSSEFYHPVEGGGLPCVLVNLVILYPTQTILSCPWKLLKCTRTHRDRDKAKEQQQQSRPCPSQTTSASSSSSSTPAAPWSSSSSASPWACPPGPGRRLRKTGCWPPSIPPCSSWCRRCSGPWSRCTTSSGRFATGSWHGAAADGGYGTTKKTQLRRRQRTRVEEEVEEVQQLLSQHHRPGRAWPAAAAAPASPCTITIWRNRRCRWKKRLLCRVVPPRKLARRRHDSMFDCPPPSHKVSEKGTTL